MLGRSKKQVACMYRRKDELEEGVRLVVVLDYVWWGKRSTKVSCVLRPE